jgi:hypothetical protein
MRIRVQIVSVLAGAMMLSAPALASAPPWLDALAKISTPEYGLEISAVCLLEENRTVVAENGEAKDYHRVAYKILTRSGRDLAWVRISYDNETKINDLKAWNLKAGGIVHEVSQKDGLETQLVGGSGTLFEDTKSLLLLIPQVEVGSVVAYEYERRHRVNVLQDFWILQSRHPVLRSRIELQLPASWEFQYRFLRRESSPPREVPRNDWVWELTNLPAIPKEEGMPPLPNVSALLVVTYFPSGDARGTRGVHLGNWDDFAVWTSQLLESRFTPSAEISDTAQKLKTPQAVGEYVQKNIRYVAIEIGIGGYQPHRAEDTFRDKHGDCKDKVTLFRSLMKALNRDVYPVVINADRGGLITEFPSPLYFNHMIAAIPVADKEVSGSAIIRHPDLGSVLLFDPTDEHTPFGQLPSALQGTQAVLVRGDKAFIIDTPVSNVADNRILRVGNFKIAPAGQLSGDMLESYWGELSVRETTWLVGQTRDEWARGASRLLSRELPGNQIRNFSVSGLEKGPLQEKYLVEADNFAQVSGNLLLFRPFVYSGPGSLPAPEETRTYPYQFTHLRSQRSNFNFQLPDGYIPESVPASQELDLPFADYKVEVTMEGNTLHYVSVYEIKKLQVQPTDFEELRRFYDLVSRTSNAVIILKRAQ